MTVIADPRRNTRTAAVAFLVVAAMVGLAFASVPLYRIFCQVTGFDGTTMRATGDAPGKVGDKQVSVRFDANVAPTLPWHFKPVQQTEIVSIGEREIAFYTAKNLSAVPITGSASFNVTPTWAGKYFSKIQCFCFTEQTLKAGEEVRMPVVFYVDPKILQDPDAKDVSEITLSYTFYPVDQPKG
ncbi:cytochrome c oxidase assembly protein [Sphingosinicella sp. BN140058]|uniref:cytochrome c oxidase assembly protein n=1 Tax=Sphingosinicella sp. BN140058 TaxID=1892855 RepID=UPI0010126102|nr:cytochrome c oxidase assembly protein [Sphingosinicella sp. BN140058]QAY76671.1 cytochrome c oxidase assembly protein [Sphingosinicella sp. BN140058]